MNDCIFCKIVRGELPNATVFEDADTLAFMDIGPIIKGHTLVIPKRHYERLTDTPDEDLNRLISLAKRIAAAQMQGLGADGVNITQANGSCAGQVVPHVHFHVIPRFENDGHSWNWKAKRYDTPEVMMALARQIAAALDGIGSTHNINGSRGCANRP